MSAVGSKWANGIRPDAENREKDDFYPTPAIAVRALLDVEAFEGDIWEPACGDGAISRVLEEAGHKVRSSDLVDRGYGETGIDFLMEWQGTADNIITNAPFKLAKPFVEHALRHSRRKVANLARLAWLEGRDRRKLFLSTPLARIWIFSNRLNMARGGTDVGNGGGGMIAFAWFVWEHRYVGKPTVGWLDTAEVFDRLTPSQAALNGERGYDLACEVLGQLADHERRGREGG